MSTSYTSIDPEDIVKVAEIFISLDFIQAVKQTCAKEMPCLKRAFERAYHDFNHHPASQNPIGKLDRHFLALRKTVHALFNILSAETQKTIQDQLRKMS